MIIPTIEKHLNGMGRLDQQKNTVFFCAYSGFLVLSSF